MHSLLALPGAWPRRLEKTSSESALKAGLLCLYLLGMSVQQAGGQIEQSTYKHAGQALTRSGDARRRNFSFDTRLRYNSALANDINTLNVLVAAQMGHTQTAAQAFEALGGTLNYRCDPVGYFWGSIPTKQIPKLLSIEEIVDIELDGPTGARSDYIEPTDPAKLTQSSVWTRQPISRPLDESPGKLPLLPAINLEGKNPYLPWYLMNVPEFLKEHPTFDGRGTTIAVVEGYGDLLHPALQSARAIDGTPVAKVAGIVDASSDDKVSYDRGTGYEAPSVSVVMSDNVTSSTDTISYRDVILTLPEPGNYRIGRLENGGRQFWVIWSPQRKSVWVDTNENHSFADEVELKDINERFSAGQIPAEREESRDKLARATSFAVEIDESNARIKFFLAQDDHATGVASIAAGEGYFGGNGNGIAPGARILYVTRGAYSLHEDIRAFILAASRPDVDVVTASFVIKPFIAGETVTSLILDRVAEVYQKPMFFTVTAGPNTTTEDISDQGTGEHVFAIMGYAPPEVWHAFYGVNVPLRDNDPDGSGDGPSMNGSLKPDFLTPFHQLAAGNCARAEWQEKSRSAVAGYRIPPCYVVFDGTSGSTPEAAALAALLISGAKQLGVKHDLARLAWAMRSSAKFLDQMPEPVGYQGYGLPDLTAAWELFMGNEATPSFSVTSHSNGPREIDRRTPNVGVGVYEYEGWHPGMDGMRELTIRRESGDKGSARFQLKWRGNDGTFTAPKEAVLPLGQDATIGVKFHLQAAGIHQAILEIVDPSDDTILHSVLNTVVASQKSSNVNQTETWKASIALAHEVCPVFAVPPETHAIAADITIEAGPALVSFDLPSASRDSTSAVSDGLPNVEPIRFKFEAPGTRHLLFARPIPGSWAICIRNHQGGSDPQGDNAAYINAVIKLSALQVDVRPEKTEILKQSNGLALLHEEVDFDNRADSLGKMVVNTQMGFAERHPITIPPAGQTSDLQFEVSEHTKQLLLVPHISENEASRIAISVYACTKKRCVLQDYQKNPQIREYKAPQPGTWKVLMYQVGQREEDDSVCGQLDVIQVPTASDQEMSSTNEVGVGPMKGGVHTVAKVDVPLLGLGSNGQRVVITEVYDLAQEEQENSSRASFRHFQADKMRPVVIGRAIQAVP